MFRRVLLAAVVLGLPGVSWGQQAPERILPGGSQIYLRWDGFAPHREAFDKTAVGKMLQGDTGTFLKGLMQFAEKQIDNVGDPQLAGVFRDIPKFFQVVGQNGFRIGVEVGKISPPEIEGMVVFPRAGKEGTIPDLFKKVAGMAGADVKLAKIGGRSVHHVNAEFLHVSWWNEGDDAVVLIGTEGPAKALKRIKSAEFTSNPLYQEVKSFKEFPTWADGFLDLGSLFKVLGGWTPEVSQLIRELGLGGIKSITFHSGFDGPAERSLVIIDVPGPRKGLLRIANQRKIKLADLPAMPSDLTSFSASNLDLAALYDAVMHGVETAVKIYAPNQLDMVKQGIGFVEATIGVKLREDLFGSMGDLFVQYSSPAEGPLGLGAVYLIKVKDAKKLRASLDSLFRAVGTLPFIQVELKKHTYHGADINEIHIGGMGNFQLPSYAIHKGWLAFSSYPQPIQGFVLRSKGELPGWKANPALMKRLEKLPQEFVAISVSDPRPTIKFILSVAPPVVALLNSLATQFAPGMSFDVSLLPNAHEATRHLFPNITIMTDDGKRVRIETRASLALPF